MGSLNDESRHSGRWSRVRIVVAISAASLAALAASLAPASARSSQPTDLHADAPTPIFLPDGIPLSELPKGGIPAPWLDSYAELSEPDQMGPVAKSPGSSSAVIWCSYYTDGDDVHKSSGAASGHGWWVKNAGTCTVANVWTQLQELFCTTDLSFCWWADRGSRTTVTVYPGGGSGNRAKSRATCANSQYTGWRSKTDVDILGMGDPSDKYYTSPQNIYCRVL